jgi:hypothetical protein
MRVNVMRPDHFESLLNDLLARNEWGYWGNSSELWKEEMVLEL